MKKKITETTFVITAVIGSFLIMLLVMVNTFSSSKQTVSATNEAVSAVSSFYLEAMADRRAQTISNLINSTFDEMGKALAFIEEEHVETQDDLRSTIGKVESLLSLNRLALVDQDDIVYTRYTTYTGRSRHEFLSEEAMQDRMISTVYFYGSSKQLCLAIPIPDYTIMGKPMKACFVQIDIRDIVSLLAFDYQGSTYFGLYSKNGGNISDTDLGPVIARQNLFDALEPYLTEDDLSKHRDNFTNGAEGDIAYASDGVAETLAYFPIQGTDWEIVVLIRESVINDQIRDISEKNLSSSRKQTAFTLIAALVLAVILLLESRMIAKRKIEAEKETSKTFKTMANTDAMTGVRNKHAYAEQEAALNQQIKDHEIEKLGVVVCDINGLKTVNDTLGHAEGDKLIKEACALICKYFSHGAVFRIGGDEFAVLLKGEGYDLMTEDIEAFNRKAEANIAEDAVVVSVGYATLKAEDRQVCDVFDRADQMMYERKKELKEMGARTR